MWQRYCIMVTPSPVCLFKHVKHGTQNIQNDYHQWLCVSFRAHQICFWPGAPPGPHWGSLQRSPDPLAGLKGPTSKGERRGGRRGKEGKGRDREFLYLPPYIVIFSISKNCLCILVRKLLAVDEEYTAWKCVHHFRIVIIIIRVPMSPLDSRLDVKWLWTL